MAWRLRSSSAMDLKLCDFYYSTFLILILTLEDDGAISEGNVLVELGKEREEWRVKGLKPAREIKRMMESNEGRGEGSQRMDLDNEKEGKEGEEWVRGNFDGGISVEGKFAFTKAVGAVCKEAVWEGRFKGNYKFNLREQIEQRAKENGG